MEPTPILAVLCAVSHLLLLGWFGDRSSYIKNKPTNQSGDGSISPCFLEFRVAEGAGFGPLLLGELEALLPG
jgi:hypothetical protein